MTDAVVPVGDVPCAGFEGEDCGRPSTHAMEFLYPVSGGQPPRSAYSLMCEHHAKRVNYLRREFTTDPGQDQE